MSQVGIEVEVTKELLVKVYTGSTFVGQQNNIPGDLSYACSRVVQRTERHFNDISDKEREFLRQHGKKDKNGNIIVENKNILFKSEIDTENYEKAQKALMKEKVRFVTYVCPDSVISELKTGDYTGPTFFLSALLDIVIMSDEKQTELKKEAEERNRLEKEKKMGTTKK